MVRCPPSRRPSLACSFGTHRLKHRAYVAVLVLRLEENMPRFHRGLVHAPEHLHRVRRCVRYDERLQTHVRVVETLFNLFDGFVELDFRVRRAEISDALRIHEDYMLPACDQEPQNEIRVEVAGLEEAYTTALAEVAKQIELLVIEEAAGVIVECLEVLHEVPLALVERHRADLDDLLVEVQ